MGYDHFTFYHTLPELDQRLRAAHEERAATFYAAWQAIKRAVSVAVHWLGGSLSRAGRARKTYRELSALSDRQLRDIGLHRAEIGSVADAAAARRPETGVTVEDLRRSGILHGEGHEARVLPLPREDQRQRRRAPWHAKRRVAAAAQRDRAAA